MHTYIIQKIGSAAKLLIAITSKKSHAFVDSPLQLCIFKYHKYTFTSWLLIIMPYLVFITSIFYPVLLFLAVLVLYAVYIFIYCIWLIFIWIKPHFTWKKCLIYLPGLIVSFAIRQIIIQTFDLNMNDFWNYMTIVCPAVLGKVIIESILQDNLNMGPVQDKFYSNVPPRTWIDTLIGESVHIPDPVNKIDTVRVVASIEPVEPSFRLVDGKYIVHDPHETTAKLYNPDAKGQEIYCNNLASTLMEINRKHGKSGYPVSGHGLAAVLSEKDLKWLDRFWMLERKGNGKGGNTKATKGIIDSLKSAGRQE